MSYCVNPNCSKPKNPPNAKVCQTCGSKILLNRRYLVLKCIGRGGFGATFLAANISIRGNPFCVIKQLRPANNAPNVFKMAKKLFEREAQTLSKIGSHPQIPSLLDYFEDNQQFYLVQEFVRGRDLKYELKNNGPFSEAGARQFLSEMLPMLQYLHAQEVIHRDLKPANIIRREKDRKLVLIDFGAVKNKVNPTDGVEGGSEQTAFTAFAVGTAGFAPPEQMALRPVYASDIYALGVTCIYLLTGKSPKKLDYHPATGEMDWESHVSISKHFTEVLRKMLEVSVRHRYQSADEVLQALDLEFHMDSLAKSLVSKPSTEVPKQNNVASRNVTRRQSAASKKAYTSQLANSIRERRSRMAQEKSLRSRNTLASNKSPVKLDAQSLLNNYSKGRRDFSNHHLSNLNFREAELSGVKFNESILIQVNFQKANLSGADFGRANLSQSMLRDANLSKAYLDYANLQGADLRGADLSFARLSNTNLKGTNLCGANLTNAKVSKEQLKEAKTNWTTILPNGKRGFW